MFEHLPLIERAWYNSMNLYLLTCPLLTWLPARGPLPILCPCLFLGFSSMLQHMDTHPLSGAVTNDPKNQNQ
jgi:hypothetical protein